MWEGEATGVALLRFASHLRYLDRRVVRAMKMGRMGERRGGDEEEMGRGKRQG